MNKYIIIIIIAVLILGGGIAYRTFLLPEQLAPVVTGVERDIIIIARQDKWIFEPELIEVDKGDKIILTMVNEDEYDHGIAIDAFGIAQRMPANGTVKTEFIVTQEGDFPFYCSVPCGEGVVDGEKRTHFDMIGRIHSRSLVSETSGLRPVLSDEEFKEQARRAQLLKAASDELGVSEDQIVIDEDNNEWLSSGGSLPALLGVSYKTLYYQPRDGSEPRKWIFIDASTGDVLGTAIDE